MIHRYTFATINSRIAVAKKPHIPKIITLRFMTVLFETSRVASRERCSKAAEAERGVGAIVSVAFLFGIRRKSYMGFIGEDDERAICWNERMSGFGRKETAQLCYGI